MIIPDIKKNKKGKKPKVKNLDDELTLHEWITMFKCNPLYNNQTKKIIALNKIGMKDGYYLSFEITKIRSFYNLVDCFGPKNDVIIFKWVGGNNMSYYNPTFFELASTDWQVLNIHEEF